MALPVLADEPRDLLLVDGDLAVRNGDLALARGIAGIAQECEIAVKTIAEEWFLDLDAGIAYLQKILGRAASVAVQLVAKKEYRDQFLKIEGVTKVSRLDTNFDHADRRLDVSWQVETALGSVASGSVTISASRVQ